MAVKARVAAVVMRVAGVVPAETLAAVALPVVPLAVARLRRALVVAVGNRRPCPTWMMKSRSE